MGVKGSIEHLIDRIYELLDSIETEMFEVVCNARPFEFLEVTSPFSGHDVLWFGKDDECEIEGTITTVLTDQSSGEISYIIDLMNGEVVEAKAEDFDVIYPDLLPAGSVMFRVKSGYNIEFTIENMSRAGFRVFESSRFGTWFGLGEIEEDEPSETREALLDLWRMH
jgi:hypothetical protein